MDFIFSIVSVILAGLFLVRPWLRIEQGAADQNDKILALARSLKREEVVEALTELEVDYRNGRLLEQDYLSSRRELSQVLKNG